MDDKSRKIMVFLNHLEAYIDLRIEYAKRYQVPTPTYVLTMRAARVELEAVLKELLNGG